MVNAFDVHRKGSTMLKIGVQLSKLNEAVAFGISFDPCKRLKQIDLNKGLVESSQGMLAPVTGSERFLTVGSSHTVAFCRAVNSGCRTTIPELSLNGSLSLSHILHGKEEGHPFKEMCIEGWRWLIIPSWVEDRFPDLPSLWQQSLNSSHAVNKQATEMEVAATIADHYSKMKLAGATPDLEKAVQAAAQSEPHCGSYLTTIAFYVKMYAGGPEFPMVHFLDQNIKKQK